MRYIYKNKTKTETERKKRKWKEKKIKSRILRNIIQMLSQEDMSLPMTDGIIYHLGDQQRLMRACTKAQSRQRLCCPQIINTVPEEVPGKE